MDKAVLNRAALAVEEVSDLPPELAKALNSGVLDTVTFTDHGTNYFVFEVNEAEPGWAQPS